MIEILVLYYSSGGSVKALANYIAKGINSVPNISARLRTVPQVSTFSEAVPQSTIPDNHHPYVRLEDLTECKALALGSPVRFGLMSAHVKYFLDGTATQWITGDLVGKPACVFTASGSMHGGQEVCLLSMMVPLLHHGMLVVGLPYTESKLMFTKSGGTPYGVTHVSGIDDDYPISEEEKQLAFGQGKRLAEITVKLNQS